MMSFDAKQAKTSLFSLTSKNFFASSSFVSLWNRKQAAQLPIFSPFLLCVSRKYVVYDNLQHCESYAVNTVFFAENHGASAKNFNIKFSENAYILYAN
jgi:hypothetical protein